MATAKACRRERAVASEPGPASLRSAEARPLSAHLLTCLTPLLGLLVAAAPAAAQLRLEPVVDGLERPAFLTHAGDGSGRLFVVEQAGRILILDHGRLLAEPFLDIQDRILAGGERGLLRLAFHPRFVSNGRYFVHCTRADDGASVIAEYHVSADPDQSRRRQLMLLSVSQPFDNHNGGMIAFGPDHDLYTGSAMAAGSTIPESGTESERIAWQDLAR